MIVFDFVIYVINKSFKGYFYTISIFSMLVTVFCISIVKFILSKTNHEILLNSNVKAFFQLSIFLFIPLFLGLIFKKYKYSDILNDKLRVKSIPTALSIFFTILLLAIGIILFTYLLIY